MIFLNSSIFTHRLAKSLTQKCVRRVRMNTYQVSHLSPPVTSSAKLYRKADTETFRADGKLFPIASKPNRTFSNVRSWSYQIPHKFTHPNQPVVSRVKWRVCLHVRLYVWAFWQILRVDVRITIGLRPGAGVSSSRVINKSPISSVVLVWRGSFVKYVIIITMFENCKLYVPKLILTLILA